MQSQDLPRGDKIALGSIVQSGSITPLARCEIRVRIPLGPPTLIHEQNGKTNYQQEVQRIDQKALGDGSLQNIHSRAV